MDSECTGTTMRDYLRGTDLEAARRALAPRQRTLATRELQAKLGAIPARPLAMAKSHPEKSRRLLALQQLYKSEIGALRADGRPPDAE